MRFVGLLLIGWLSYQPVTVWSAVRYVSMIGSDTNSGTTVAPWRTIQKAVDLALPGDVVLVSAGDYAEYVQTRRAGLVDAPITFRAAPANDPQRPALLRSFRIGHAHIVVEGFTFAAASDSHLPAGASWGATIRVEPGGSHAVITNNTIKDAAYLVAPDFTFNFQDNSISTPSGDFRKAGFVPQSHIYLGACGVEPHYYANHDTLWLIKNVSLDGRTIWVTNRSDSTFAPDPGAYWAAIFAGNGNGAMPAISFVKIGGEAAVGCTIAGNTFSNIFGAGIVARGNDTVIENNRFADLGSYNIAFLNADNIVFRGNTVKRSRNLLYFTAEEEARLIHPPGSGWYDFQVSMIVSTVGTNIVVEKNWVEDVDNALGSLTGDEFSRDITFRSNVFVGITAAFSGGKSDMKWLNNTFYRCSYSISGHHPLSLGGRPPAQTGYLIASNVFVDCGSEKNRSNQGWYAVSTNALVPVADYNFVCGAETTGWSPKQGFVEANGVNGGDPCFWNVLDPMGPDNVPFTDDDGLRPLPSSPLARLGLGALRPKSTVEGPLAHFTVRTPTGWLDASGPDFDPVWTALKPFERKQAVRHWSIPEALGYAPVAVEFDASASFDGLSSPSVGSQGIQSYRWVFGDGLEVTTQLPFVKHNYSTPGLRTVVLTVTNGEGQVSTIANRYRVLSSGVEVARPLPPGALRVTDADSK